MVKNIKSRKDFITNKPAIDITMVGFGQAGSRMADEFAAYKNIEGNQTYNCLALNSNDGDLEGLKNIPVDNRVSLNLGGLGKNPEKAIGILEENKDAKEKLKSFIKDKIRPEDDLVLFFAGLGGGTGTSTIVKAIDEFYDYKNKPLIISALEEIKTNTPPEEFRANPKMFLQKAFKMAESKFVKIGVIVTLPLRNEGPDVLRQVNDFSQQIWKLANNPAKGIAFVTFADNQHFSDEFNEIPVNQRKGINNYRDYGNKLIASIFHELNTATTMGGSSITLDAQDFRRAITEHMGSLVLSKVEAPIQEVKNADSLVNLFKETLQKPTLHAPIELVREEDGKQIAKKVHHVGILSIINGRNEFGGGAFLEKSIDNLHDELPINGTVFSGYVNTLNDFNASAYTFYKVDGLPERLEKGLVEEYQAYMERNRKIKFETSSIQSIKSDSENELQFDIGDLGLDHMFEDLLTEDNTEIEEEITIEDMVANFDFSAKENRK